VATAVVLASAAAAPAVALGQRPRHGQRREMRRGEARPPIGRGGIIAGALRQVGLTPEQHRAIREIRDRHDSRMRDFGRHMLDGRREVDELLFADTPSIERARARAQELSRLAGERHTARTLIELEVFRVLTPEQRSAIRRMREEGRGRPREGPRGRAARPAPEPEPPDEEPLDEEPSDDDVEPPPAGPRGPRRGARPERAGPGAILARMQLTPEQQARFRQLRRERAPRMRDLASRFRQTQRAIDDALVADALDAELVRRLAGDLGRVEAERELARFENEAAIRQLLTPEQAVVMRDSRRARWR
jgi:Spy/CpxP family protein refolding chaperone